MRLLSRGFSATSYATPDGYVIRVAHDDQARQRQVREVRLLQAIRERFAGFDLPFPAEVFPPSSRYPFGAVRYRLLLGRPPDENVDPSTIADFLRRLHDVPAASVQSILGSYEAWLDLQLVTAAEGAAALNGRLDVHTARWLDAFIEDLPELIRGVETPTVVHGDFWGGNMCVRESRLTGVLDWEAAAIGDPAVDLAGLWYLGAALPMRISAELSFSMVDLERAHCFRIIRELTGAAWSGRRRDVQELRESAAKISAVVADVRADGAIRR
jgi:aminoglycoside phosphotransferase (APT) family kinase protein